MGLVVAFFIAFLTGTGGLALQANTVTSTVIVGLPPATPSAVASTGTDGLPPATP